MVAGLVDKHPLVLIALNPRNRNLILVTNQLSAWSYYLVGTIRLVISDPLFFLIGYWWGDAALVWTERRTRTLGKTLRRWEGWFAKAAYPLVFLAPNQWICLFAGAAGMEVVPFFVVNIAGTEARLYALRWLGNAFQRPIDDVLHFISDYRTPLLIASIVIVLLLALSELRSGGPNLEEIEEIQEELATQDRRDLDAEER
jgi:membrane protein DedA with SNARE-associated domain